MQLKETNDFVKSAAAKEPAPQAFSTFLCHLESGENHLISGTQCGGYKPSHPPILRYCKRFILDVTMLTVPGVSKGQYGPGLQ